ncbi:geranylgeranyl reductase [Methanolacinia petrolearia DSM 11571]|uniref:Geranylgeranyl reductase n=1 Tax=Methanolacinia petrolearia (strain DSM 11571 / OCM 486 / SEBR 4847) TaxID=679926 RepID=E1RIW7_METP4|nr:NAD(P)/FAD-dependent oxidoreductase [Methanolacinia petrolearia]ADN35555.1 geranylgeranyl reductase [Methanolacinia petrolearia DSM 11571]
MIYDVIVAGGGPAGSMAAKCCAKAGLNTLLVEEHAAVGTPVQCAGLLSTNAFFECEVSDRSVIQTVSGARVVSGLSCEFSFDAGEIKAYVVDRSAFDREMLEAAANAGAEIMLKTSVNGAIADNSGCTVSTTGVSGKQNFRSKMIVAADGPRSNFSRFFGMKRAPVFLSGIQADVPYESDGRLVELHPYASPGFFGWVIPAGKGRARVGLCAEKDTNELFTQFIKQFGPTNVHQVTGTIPIGIMPRTYGNRTLFCGDAAGFAKPTSGGGVYTGVRSARHAADTIAGCIESGDFGDRALSRYESLWKADFGRELAFGVKLFKMRKGLTPEIIDDLCRVMNEKGMAEDIIRYGDMDRPGKIVKKMALNPSIYRVAGKVIGSELRSLFFRD